MNIIKIKASDVGNFEKYNNFIVVSIQTDYNYYLVEDCKDYEVVGEVTYGGGLPDKNLDGIIVEMSFMSNMRANNEIQNLQDDLNASDYQVIKSYEYNLVNLPSPYNINELHDKRQQLRDKINKIKETIKPVKSWEELSNIVMFNNPLNVQPENNKEE